MDSDTVFREDKRHSSLVNNCTHEEILRDKMVGVSKFKAYQELKLALEMINGSHAG